MAVKTVRRPWYIMKINKRDFMDREIFTFKANPWNHYHKKEVAENLIKKIPLYLKQNFNFEARNIFDENDEFPESEMLKHRWGDPNTTIANPAVYR